MQKLIDLKYQMLNPLIIEVVTAEKTFFYSCGFILNNLCNKLGMLTQISGDTKITYNPLNYIRGPKLINSTYQGQAPPEFEEKKYTYEDYKKMREKQNKQVEESMKSGGGFDLTKYAQGNVFQNNNNKEPENKYSYQAYLKNKKSDAQISSNNNAGRTNSYFDTNSTLNANNNSNTNIPSNPNNNIMINANVEEYFDPKKSVNNPNDYLSQVTKFDDLTSKNPYSYDSMNDFNKSNNNNINNFYQPNNDSTGQKDIFTFDFNSDTAKNPYSDTNQNPSGGNDYNFGF